MMNQMSLLSDRYHGAQQLWIISLKAWMHILRVAKTKQAVRQMKSRVLGAPSSRPKPPDKGIPKWAFVTGSNLTEIIMPTHILHRS